MQVLEVGTIVDSILAGFGNATDVFKRLKAQSQGRKVKKTAVALEERQLQQCLSDGPSQIKSQYDRNAAVHGKHFIVGDVHTQNALARILFNLNSGLMEIISSLLDKNTKRKLFTTQSLLSLSERTTIDTLSALETLEKQLSAAAVAEPYSSRRVNKQKTQKRRQSEREHPSKGVTSVPTTDMHPLLVRGGWIRTRSGNSMIVSAEDARRRAAQKVDKRRMRTVNQISSNKTSFRRADHFVHHAPPLVVPSESTWPCKVSANIQSHEDFSQLEFVSVPEHEQQRPPSLYLVPADIFRQQTAPVDWLPPRPPKIPLHTRPNVDKKPRPLSGITFATISTKLGEIPEHKIPDLPLSEEELKHRPLPYLIPPPLMQPPQKARKGFWLFRMKK